MPRLSREEVLNRLVAEAYIVVGILAAEAGRFNDPQVIKALDNFASQTLEHTDVIPFASKAALIDPLRTARALIDDVIARIAEFTEPPSSKEKKKGKS